MNSGFTQKEQGFYPQNPKNLFVVKQRQSLIYWAAPLEWSKLKVIAWLAFGPSGWWPLAQADGTPMHYLVVWCCNSSSIFQWWFELHGASRRLHRLAIYPASSHWNSRNIHFPRGDPGSMYAVFAPTALTQPLTASAMYSGSLSDRM